jgi:hypothetical protein
MGGLRNVSLESVLTIVAILVAILLWAIPAVWRRWNQRGVSAADFQTSLKEIPKQHKTLLMAAGHHYAAGRADPGFPLLTRPMWVPETPIPDHEIELNWRPDASATVSADSPDVRRQLPRPYARYSKAIMDLANPVLLDDRYCYRLLEVRLSQANPELVFGETSYFEGLDLQQPLILEAARLARRETDPARASRRLRSRRARLRRLLGDPFDLARRPYFAGLETLTLRRQGNEARFRLHERFPGKVAVAGALLSVAPTAVFQPSAVHHRDAKRDDLDLWKNTVREFAEEYLGLPEAEGKVGTPLKYDQEPYAGFMKAKTSGQIRHWVLGVGVDPLSLSPKILTVAVFDSETYDRLLEDRLAEGGERSEGQLIGPLSFDRETVEEYFTHSLIAPGSAACLRLAWKHRDILLGPILARQG